MPAEIHRLTEAGPSIGPEPKVVAEIEKMLDLALAGDVRGVGFFWVNAAGTTCTSWESGCASASLMVSGAARLNHRVLTAATDDAEPIPDGPAA